MKVVGLRVEKYVGHEVDGHDCDFEVSPAVFDRHILNVVYDNGVKAEITLSEYQTQCMSGWTVAYYGEMSIKQVDKFKGSTHSPNGKLVIEDIPLDFCGDELKNDVFSYYSDGGDMYYPMGGYNVDMKKFKKSIRAKDRRPVWIFKGSSTAGKSFLAANTELTVYETDSSDTLPEMIIESIVVLGNKYPFTVEEIKPLLFGEPEIIVVDFKFEN